MEMWREAPPIDQSRLSLPTLVIHGDLDAIVPVEHAHTLAQLIPDAELLILENTGHVPTLTRRDEVAAAIDQYFPLSN